MLLLLMYGLLVFGVFMIQSAARNLDISAEELAQYGSAGALYASKQKNWILVGTVVFFATALLDYRWIRWLALPAFGVSLVLIAAAKFYGNKVHQLEFGGIKFQPVQMGIVAGILMIAWLLQDFPRIHRWFGSSFSRIGVIGVSAGLPFLMAAAVGDTGSALVWVPVTLVALLVGGVAFRHILFMMFIGAGVVPILYFVVLPSMGSKKPPAEPAAAAVVDNAKRHMSSGERAKLRIDIWLDMLNGREVNVLDEAYGAHHASMAVGKAGWKGIGWNASAEKKSLVAQGFLPKDTTHNDYIFAVIAEELGFRGSLALLIAFAVLLVQCLLVAYYSRDISGRLIAALVLTLVFAHVFESIGMCVLLLPITGIPLPFISYSGTFVVICMFLMGLVQSVWIHRFDRPSRIVESAAEPQVF